MFWWWMGDFWLAGLISRRVEPSNFSAFLVSKYSQFMNRCQLAAVVLFCVLSPLTVGAENKVTRVVIRSSWAGLGIAPEAKIVIQKVGGGYHQGHRQIDSRSVDVLASALDEKPLPRPTLINLGVTERWLKCSADIVIRADLSWEAATATQKKLFVSSFTDPDTIALVLPSLYGFVRTDDYPSVQLELSFDDGSTISVSSHTPYQFTLPWKVVRGGETISTFNANISRAIAALMPKKATNRVRLTGEGLDSDLAGAVYEKIKKQWNLLEVEDKASDALNLLKSRYIVEAADINRYHNVDYGVAWKPGAAKETNLQITLRKPSFPANFSERAILLYENGTVHGTDSFLAKIGEYENLVESVPWLTRYRTENPSVLFQLTFVHNESFGDKAMSVFEGDMKAIGKSTLTEEIRAVQDKVALIAAGYGGYWLVLPDRRMVLWRYSTTAGLLNLTAAALRTTRCVEYNTVSGGCVGAIVTPDGAVTN